jgi:hypothetical protein
MLIQKPYRVQKGLHSRRLRAATGGKVYAAMDMGWAKLVGQIAGAYRK